MNFKLREGDQPLPVINDAPDIQTQVVADIADRRQVGISRYGTALQPHNGRDALRDLYEELLDAVMYVKQVMVERGPVPTSEETGAAGHDLVISFGDCEFGGQCTCGKPLGTIKPDRSLDELGRAWETHVMTEVPR